MNNRHAWPSALALIGTGVPGPTVTARPPISATRALALAPPAPSPSGLTQGVSALRRYSRVDDCTDDGPPGAACRHTECRYHLAHRGYWEHTHRPTHDCSIDVANEGPHTLDEVAVFMGISGERVRQIEEQALEQLKHSATLKDLHDESPY